MVPCTKSRLFEVPSTFLALKMALAWRLVPFHRTKKVLGTSKSLDFVPALAVLRLLLGPALLGWPALLQRGYLGRWRGVLRPPWPPAGPSAGARRHVWPVP